MTKKYTKAITIGEIIFPNNSPNFNHMLFRGTKSFELNNTSIKKTTAITNDQILIPFELNIGQIP